MHKLRLRLTVVICTVTLKGQGLCVVGLIMNNNDNLKQRQAYPLELKVEMSKLRIREWHKHWHGKVYVAFSGGKDSTVLLDLVRSIYPDTVAVFNNTFNEFPEVLKFIRTIPNVTWITPKMNVEAAIKKYGYPVISKETSQKISEARNTKSKKLLYKRLHGADNKYKSGRIPFKWQYLIKRGEYQKFKISDKCCDVLKKRPSRKFEKETGLHPMFGVMANDSHLRNQKNARKECNSFEGKRLESNPMMFWTTDDVWAYIKQHDLPYSSIYDMGWDRTGCVACCFGLHMEKSDLFHKNRFQRMKQTHPKLWNYCINKLGLRQVLNAINVNYE